MPFRSCPLCSDRSTARTCPPPSSPTQEECLPPHKRRLRAAEDVNATRRSPAFPGKILALPVFPLGVKMMIFPSPAALKSLRYPRSSQLQTSARRRNQTNQTIPAAATKPLTPTQSACLPAKASSKKRLPLQQYFPRPSQRSVASQSSKNASVFHPELGSKSRKAFLDSGEFGARIPAEVLPSHPALYEQRDGEILPAPPPSHLTMAPASIS